MNIVYAYLIIGLIFASILEMREVIRRRKTQENNENKLEWWFAPVVFVILVVLWLPILAFGLIIWNFGDWPNSRRNTGS